LRVLLDENVPRSVRRALPRHDVRTVADMGWEGIKNGELMKLIETERFDVFLTGDKNFSKQQNLAGRHVALLVMSAVNWPVASPTCRRSHAPLMLLSPADYERSSAGTSYDAGRGESAATPAKPQPV